MALTMEVVAPPPPGAPPALTRTLRAVIYCRISRDRVGAGLGVERQEGDCRELAARLADQFDASFIIVAVLVDNDVSAFSGRKRRDYERLCQLMESGTVDVVLTWHNDRLHRSPRELEDYIELSISRDIPTFTVTAGDYDLSTSNGRFQARIGGAIARRESEHRSERVSSAAKQRAFSGGASGGPRPFGFEADGETIRPEEAAEIADGTAAVLRGENPGAKVASLNARGIFTSTGKPWTTSAWRLVLLRERNAGIRVYQGQEVGPASWDAIVSESDYRAVVALLKDPSRRTSTGNQPKWLGSKIYLCRGEGCGATMISTKRSGCPNYIYRCDTRGAGHAMRDRDSLDAFITARIVNRLSKPDAARLVRKGSGEDVGPLLAEKAALNAQLDALGLEVARGMNPRVAAVAAGEIERKLAELDGRLAAVATVDPLAAIVGAGDVFERWQSLHITARRAILRELLVVEVRPLPTGSRTGGPADPMDGLTLTWKRGE